MSMKKIFMLIFAIVILIAFVYQTLFFQHRECDITIIGVIDEKGGISNQPIDKFNLYSKTHKVCLLGRAKNPSAQIKESRSKQKKYILEK